MKITYEPYYLQLKHQFAISGYKRTETPILLIQIAFENYIGFGEASMVPYLGENLDTAVSFIKKVNLSNFSSPLNIMEIMQYIDSIEQGHPAIKAAFDIALHDLSGKILKQPCYKIFNSNPEDMPCSSYTLGIDEPKIIIEKVHDAINYGFKILKIKLGSDHDKLLINTVRSVSSLPIYVDANQGWKSKSEGLEMVNWLADKGVILIEQPMNKLDVKGNEYITKNSPIPIIADEAFQRLEDIEKVANVYNGVNIKLMKSTGLYEAKLMINAARQLGLKIMIGCMSETSVATLAAASIAPLCDYCDLDGPFLTVNNPFKTPLFREGKYVLRNLSGLGVEEM